MCYMNVIEILKQSIHIIEIEICHRNMHYIDDGAISTNRNHKG